MPTPKHNERRVGASWSNVICVNVAEVGVPHAPIATRVCLPCQSASRSSSINAATILVASTRYPHVQGWNIMHIK